MIASSASVPMPVHMRIGVSSPVLTDEAPDPPTLLPPPDPDPPWDPPEPPEVFFSVSFFGDGTGFMTGATLNSLSLPTLTVVPLPPLTTRPGPPLAFSALSSTFTFTHVSEIELPGQTYPEIDFQNWRHMVLPSFLPEDQELFLSRTEPGYIASRLTTMHDSFYFDVRMQTIARKRIWTRHTMFRIMNYSSSHLMILYTVRDINEEKLQIQQKIRELEEHLLYDSLTLTYNSKTMQELVTEASRNASREHPCSLIYVSLKPDAVSRTEFYNTQNDELLIDLAGFLKENLPPNTVIAHSRHTAFVCMLPDTPIGRAEKGARTLLKRYRKSPGQNHPDVCFGIGILSITPHENLVEIRQRLDQIGIAVMKTEGSIALTEDQLPREERKKRNSDIILDQIEDDIRLNYSQKLTLSSLGEKYFINSAYLGQLFIQRHNMTFSEYLWKERLTQAARQLTETNKYIYEILTDVGATNANYFKKLFVARYGMTPTQYRKKNRP